MRKGWLTLYYWHDAHLVLMVVLPPIVIVPAVPFVVPIAALFAPPIVTVPIPVSVSVVPLPSPSVVTAALIVVIVAVVASLILEHPNLFKTPMVPVEVEVAIAIVEDHHQPTVVAPTVPAMSPLNRHPDWINRLCVGSTRTPIHPVVRTIPDPNCSNNGAGSEADVSRHPLGGTGGWGSSGAKHHQTKSESNSTSDHGILRLKRLGIALLRALCQRRNSIFDK